MKNLTVAITTYNRWELCFKALKSIYRQNIAGMEVILVDDCSSARMPPHVKEFIETNRVVFIRHKTNTGLAGARNSAIERAGGDYLSFCDDDDQWPEGFGDRLLKAVQSGPSGVEMAVALPNSCCEPCKRIFSSYPRLTYIMRQGYSPPSSSQIYSTKIVRQANGYNPKIMSGVDHDLWISLSKFDPRVAVSWGGTAIIDTDLVKDRITTVEDLRRLKINESLAIWKPQIVETFGEGFYQHFCSSYEQYLDFMFFLKSFRQGNYYQATLRLLNPRVLSKVAAKIMYKKIRKQPCKFFPAYKG